MSTQTPSNTTRTAEIKTALPGPFSGKTSEASRWLKAMDAYFLINPTTYSSDELKLALILSKMDAGKGIAFSEKWYDRLQNSTLKSEDKTLAKFVEDYNENFNPLDAKVRARRDLSKLVQVPGKDEDGTPNDGFQDFVNKFENLATKAQFEDKLTAVTQFSTGLDRQLSTMILSMQSPPDTLEEWIAKAKVFHNQKLRIDELKRGTRYSNFRTPYSPSSRTTADPNAMDVDTVRLKKLSPQERAKCMKEGRCFRCRKTGHDARNCRIKTNSTETPRTSQQIRTTEEPQVITEKSLITPSPKNPEPSPFATYAQSLGKSEEELLQTLKLCYEDLDEEVKVAETFEDLQDF